MAVKGHWTLLLTTTAHLTLHLTQFILHPGLFVIYLIDLLSVPYSNKCFLSLPWLFLFDKPDNNFQLRSQEKLKWCFSGWKWHTYSIYICSSLLFIELSFVQLWHHFFFLFAQIVDNNFYSKHICCDVDLQTRGKEKGEQDGASTTESLQRDQHKLLTLQQE